MKAAPAGKAQAPDDYCTPQFLLDRVRVEQARPMKGKKGVAKKKKG